MLIGWVPICLILMAALPRRVSVVVAVVGGWLILPPSAIAISGLSSFTKQSALTYGVLLGTLLFTPDRLLRLRPHWLDLWVIGYSVSPFFSSMTNGLGAYDGGSAVLGHTSVWALPYLVGRIHFQGERNLRDLLRGMVVACIILIPFCLYEMRMSPTLLTDIYGLGRFQGMRLGGWRPRILFTNGLEFGLWMSMCFLAGVWLWRSGTFQRFAGWPVGRFWLPVLGVVTLLCRSSGALALLALGLGVLWTARRFRSRLAMLFLVLAPLIYVGVRVPDLWDYSGAVTFLREYFDEARAQSFEFRLQNEDVLVAKAVEKPLFGWGGWGRARVYDETGRDLTVTDGFWVIALGNNGAFGLAFFLSMFIAPALLFIKKSAPEDWTSPAAAGQAAAVCLNALFMIDCLFNAFPTAVYVVVLGGLVATLQLGRESTLASDKGAEERRQPEPPSVPHPYPSSPVLSPNLAEARLADRYIELARSSGRAGDGAEAVSAWRHALELLESRRAASPEDPTIARRHLDCLNDLAWFLAVRPDPEAGDRNEAVGLARQTTEALPGEPAYWNTLALALYRTGDDLGALEAANRSMDLSEFSTGFDSVVLALAHARIGRKGDARRWLAATKQWRAMNRVNGETLDDLIREADAALGS